MADSVFSNRNGNYLEIVNLRRYEPFAHFLITLPVATELTRGTLTGATGHNVVEYRPIRPATSIFPVSRFTRIPVKVVVTKLVSLADMHPAKS